MQVELFVVELFVAIKLLELILTLIVSELDDRRVVTDLVSIAVLDIPQTFLLIDIKDVVTFKV